MLTSLEADVVTGNQLSCRSGTKKNQYGPKAHRHFTYGKAKAGAAAAATIAKARTVLGAYILAEITRIIER